MVFRIFLAALVCCFFLSNSFSQDLASIEGKVIDAKTKEALPGVAVYLANTAIGVSADINGLYLLNKIPSGKYDLTASLLGYKIYTKSMVFDGNSLKGFVIYLVEESIQLSTVEVKARRQGNNNDFVTFQKYFLGSTLNSSKCKIINSHDVLIDNKSSSLVAKSYKPIEIENNALGYRVFYILKEFVIDKTNKTVRISGIPRFENLIPENRRQEMRWAKERDRTYYGSVEHFIRSLKQRELKKNHFTLYDAGRNEISEDKLFTNHGDSVIMYKGNLQLVFSAELADPTFDPKRGVQESTLVFSGPGIKLYNNGSYENFADLFLQGYLGWSSCVAELMPLGYQPVSKLH